MGDVLAVQERPPLVRLPLSIVGPEAAWAAVASGRLSSSEQLPMAAVSNLDVRM
jgi:hypothetical protein